LVKILKQTEKTASVFLTVQ